MEYSVFFASKLKFLYILSGRGKKSEDLPLPRTDAAGTGAQKMLVLGASKLRIRNPSRRRLAGTGNTKMSAKPNPQACTRFRRASTEALQTRGRSPVRPRRSVRLSIVDSRYVMLVGPAIDSRVGIRPLVFASNSITASARLSRYFTWAAAVATRPAVRILGRRTTIFRHSPAATEPASTLHLRRGGAFSPGATDPGQWINSVSRCRP